MNSWLVVLACLGTFEGDKVELEIWSGHKYISQCHVESTIRGFDNPEQQCFCIEKPNEK